MQLNRPAFSRPGWSRVRRDGDGPWRVLLTVLALAAAVIALVAVLAHAIAWSWQPMVILAAGAHYPLWAAPIGLVLALLARRWATAVAAVVLTVVVLFVQVPPMISTSVPAHGTPIVVLQANLKLGTAHAPDVVALVRENGVSLLATEELTEPEQQRLIDAGLSTLLPYHFTVASTPGAGNGIGMWSKYPLSQQHWDRSFELKVLTAHVALPGGNGMTFVAAHLEPPFPQDPTEWTRELPRFGRLLHGLPSTGPVLAAGDYNSTIDHAQFRALLTGGYADSDDQAGAGYVPTFPTDHWTGPFIGIDHVLTRKAVATDVSSVDLPGSDHRGLLVHVMLETGGS